MANLQIRSKVLHIEQTKERLQINLQPFLRMNLKIRGICYIYLTRKFFQHYFSNFTFL